MVVLQTAWGDGASDGGAPVSCQTDGAGARRPQHAALQEAGGHRAGQGAGHGETQRTTQVRG